MVCPCRLHLTRDEWKALPEKTASYIIRKSGTQIQAINGSTGKIDYSGTDAATVIQNAINALSTTGGKIFIRNGLYVLSAPISLQNKSIWLVGESRGGTILRKAGAVILFNNSVDVEQRIADMTVDGYDRSGDGIFATCVHKFTIENVMVINCNVGIHIKGPAGYRYVLVRNTLVEEPNRTGMLIEHGDNQEAVANITVEGGKIFGSPVSLYIRGNVAKIRFRDIFIAFYGTAIKIETINIPGVGDFLPDSITFEDCWVETSAEGQTYLNMVMGAGATHYPIACQFIGNYFTGKDGTLNFVGNMHRIIANNIGGFSRGTWNIILNGNYNVMSGWTVSYPWDVTFVYSIAGSGNKVKDNYGYVTENSGTATIPNGATSVTVAHGLAGTPRVVIVTGRHSETVDAYVSARDGTNITIAVPTAVTGNRDVDWYAEL